MPIPATREEQNELTAVMDMKFDKDPTGIPLLRSLRASRSANKITIDWKNFRTLAFRFCATATLTTAGICIGACLLLFINTAAEGDLSVVACQALTGIASLPLMAVSSLLLVQAGLLLTLFLVWLPNTGKLGKFRQTLKGSYKGIPDFSIQLPLAIGGVSAATSIYLTTAITSLAVLLPLCLGISGAQKLVFWIIFYGGESEQSIGWKWAAFMVALVAFAGFAYAPMHLDWRPFLYTPPLC